MRRRITLALLLCCGLVLAACQVNWQADNGVTGGVSCPAIPTNPTTTVNFTCTGSVVPSPAPTSTTSTAPPTTTTVPPTTTTAPTTTTTTTPPPSGQFPTPSTTGYPAGTVFKTVNGDLTITSPGTYNALHVTGSILVQSPNVTITNSWVEGIGTSSEAIDNETTALGSGRMTVSNTTIGNNTCNPQPGIGEHDYTADHIKIQGFGDGIRVSGSNVKVTNSFVQTCDDPNNHDDGMQVYCPNPPLPQPCQNVDMEHNTLSNAQTRNFTAPLFGGVGVSTNGALANSKFLNNMLWGGVFTIYLEGSGLDIEHNWMATNSWVDPDGSGTFNGWVYGYSSVSCSTVTWNDNRTVAKDGNWQPVGSGTVVGCA